jgi:hypothetical protein
MSFCIRILLPLLLALALAACDSSSTGPASLPDREFTDAQRAACPANPFRPEFPMAPKRAAAARPVDFHIEIYTSRGRFVQVLDGEFDPEQASSRPGVVSPVWDAKDASGNEVPSGYYFMVTTLTDPASGYKSTNTQCIFRVNPADEDKMK